MPMAISRPRGRAVRVWRDTSTAGAQRRLRAFEARTREQWIHAPQLFPDLVQTSDYATAVVTADAWAAGRATGGEVGDAVAERMSRQDRWRKAARPRRLTVVIGEQALYTTVGNPKVMQIQLMHLLGLLDDPPAQAALMIVPRTAHYRGPVPEFTVFDTDRVAVTSVSGALILSRARDVAAYRSAFTRQVEHAVTGEDAVELITEAITFHSSTPN